MVRKNSTVSEASFEVVSDDERGPIGARRLSPWVQALFDGKTVKVHIDQGRLGGYYKTAERHGFKLRSRAVEDGTIVWADPVEDLNGK